MTKKINKFILVLILGLSVSCAKPNQEAQDESSLTAPVASQEFFAEPPEVKVEDQSTTLTQELVPPVAPKPSEPAVLLDHKYFKIKYLTKHRLPKYVRWELTAANLKRKNAKRSNVFKLDPLLIDLNVPPVLPHDYFRTGYDRGHLAPSADFLWDQKANDQTFVMSNIAPQAPQLNTGSWMHLEDRVRRWACREKKLIVIAGPVIDPNLPKMKSGVSIPKRFFKLVLDDTPPRKAIAFIFNQNDEQNQLQDIQLSGAQLAAVVGEDFSQEFPKEDRERLKDRPSLSDWTEEYCVRREL